MNQDVQRFFLVLILMVVFALLIYPTPYRFEPDTIYYKTNWITGTTSKYNSEKGKWEKLVIVKKN